MLKYILSKINIISIVSGVVILGISIALNWWLFKEIKNVESELVLSQRTIKELEISREQLQIQSEQLNESTQKYVSTIQQLQKERDYLRSISKSKKEKDSEYRKWSETPLPRFVADKYNGMYKNSLSEHNN